jgi:hypothetical protein
MDDIEERVKMLEEAQKKRDKRAEILVKVAVPIVSSLALSFIRFLLRTVWGIDI